MTSFLRSVLVILLSLLALAVGLGLIALLGFAFVIVVIALLVAYLLAPEESQAFWRTWREKMDDWLARSEGVVAEIRALVNRFTDKPVNPSGDAAAQPEHEVLSDLGSGLNCKKPGLKKLLSKIFHQEVKTLVLLHHDRLLRFGTELVYWLCRKKGTDVWVVEQREDTPFEEELVKDVLTLMTVFCARLYGKRSRRKGLSS